MRQQFNVKLQWIHFPLHPETPPEGQSLEQLFAGRDVDLNAMYQQMKGLMDIQGLPYSLRTHTYNSRLAQELGKWGDTHASDALHNALYQAYFVNRKNISDIEILVEVAASVGLDPIEARDVLEMRTFKAEIDEDWAKSRQYRITGVPTFMAAGYVVVGVQEYSVLERLLGMAEATPHH